MTAVDESVVIVVAPDFGERLPALARRCDVWIVDSPANRAAAEACWSKRGESRTVTVFDATRDESPEAATLRILDMVELHHPGVTRYHFAGVALASPLADDLARRGFAGFVATDLGFEARKLPD